MPRNVALTLASFAIAFFGCKASGMAVPVAPHAPFMLIVPYFKVVGDIRGSNGVSVYNVNPASGAITLVPGSPFASGKDPTAAATAPGGGFAYVVNKGSNTISAYDIDAGTGAFTAVAGSPFGLNYSAYGPMNITIDPAGKYAYVVSDIGVSAFSIDDSTGALKSVPGSPFAAGSDGFGTVSVAVDPADRFAYVLNYFANTFSPYAIGPTGALTLVDSPLAAGQNSNDMDAFRAVTIDPKGTFAYVTGSCCVNVYPIDATSGTLAAPAHLRFGLFDQAELRGFTIDPTGRFAYAIDDSRVYAYTIEAATGKLKALGNWAFASGNYGDPYGITIEPTGKFAYVLDRGSNLSAPAIFAYRIDPAGRLAALAHSPFAVATSTSDPIARWFNAGRCAAFERGAWTGAAPPVVKRDSEGVTFQRVSGATGNYFYDPKNGWALHYPVTDSGGTLTLRTSGPPPADVAKVDLSKLHTASGIKLGSSAATVSGLLGMPKIVTGCGVRRYVYLRNRDGEETSLQFTIANGRVTEIFEDFGG